MNIMMQSEVRIRQIGKQQRTTVERLAQIYEHDFSEIEELEVNADGTYATPYLEKYFTQKGKKAFLFYIDNVIAGFALIDNTPRIFIDMPAYRVGEFFIQPALRGKGIGKKAAFLLFDTYPGKWEVQETKVNVGAQRFWRRVFEQYTNGQYEETLLDPDPANPHGPIQHFDSGSL